MGKSKRKKIIKGGDVKNASKEPLETSSSKRKAKNGRKRSLESDNSLDLLKTKSLGEMVDSNEVQSVEEGLSKVIVHSGIDTSNQIQVKPNNQKISENLTFDTDMLKRFNESIIEATSKNFFGNESSSQSIALNEISESLKQAIVSGNNNMIKRYATSITESDTKTIDKTLICFKDLPEVRERFIILFIDIYLSKPLANGMLLVWINRFINLFRGDFIEGSEARKAVVRLKSALKHRIRISHSITTLRHKLKNVIDHLKDKGHEEVLAGDFSNIDKPLFDYIEE